MLGMRKEEAESRLGVWCRGCDAEVDVMEWWADPKTGHAQCPWCSEDFYAWANQDFDPENLLGIRAYAR